MSLGTSPGRPPQMAVSPHCSTREPALGLCLSPPLPLTRVESADSISGETLLLVVALPFLANASSPFPWISLVLAAGSI